MDSVSATRGLVAPDPRPVVRGPSTAVRDPEPKPAPGDVKPERRHDHPRAAREHGARGRSHVQQGLRHIVRDIRHAIRDEVKAGVASGEIDRETVDAIRDLQRDFGRDLHGVFLEAGQKGGIDRQQVLGGMIEALQSLTAGLRELSGGGEASGEARPDPVPDELTPVAQAPGSLVDLTG